MPIIVVPKRKMLPLQKDTVQPEPLGLPASKLVPPMNLSELLIDTDKNWADFAIESLGAASDNTGAARKIDLDAAVVFIIDGGGVAITTGQKGYIRLPFAGTILSVALMADQVGDIVIDIWKDAITNFPPTVADTIIVISGNTWLANTAYTLDEYVQPTVPNGFNYKCTTAGTSHATTEPTWLTVDGGTTADGTVVWTVIAAKPTLSNESASLDATLTGWTKTFAAGDILAFNVDSCTTITRVTLTLVVRRT